MRRRDRTELIYLLGIVEPVIVYLIVFLLHH